jgi:hypothetical protein
VVDGLYAGPVCHSLMHLKRVCTNKRRRLSSGLGLAAGADERQLRAGFPRHVAGFQSPVALNINVRIARITDEIMSCMLHPASFEPYADLYSTVWEFFHHRA